MIEVLRRAWLGVVTAPVRLYQLLISPGLPARCKYSPSCSSYAVSALRSYGLVRGSILAIWRLLRCNPFSHGGYDPVDAQTLFRHRAGVEPCLTHSSESQHRHPEALV